MIRVLIADDHPVVRRGLKSIIADTPDITVAGEASNSEEIHKLTRRSDFDVLLLDISMPGRNGLDVLKDLKSVGSTIKVLVLSIYPDEIYGVRALLAGASGYLTKDAATDELINAIRKVAHGGRYITASLADVLAFNLISDVSQPLHHSLSDREFEVMCLVASGKRIRDIATELSLSPKTISTYRRRVMNKMRMKNNNELIKYMVSYHLMD